MRPYIVEKIIKHNGEEIEIKPEIQRFHYKEEGILKIKLFILL